MTPTMPSEVGTAIVALRTYRTSLADQITKVDEILTAMGDGVASNVDTVPDPVKPLAGKRRWTKAQRLAHSRRMKRLHAERK